MKKFVILTDVTSDLSREVRERFGVSDYVHGHIHFSNGLDFKTAMDWDGISREEFYDHLSNRQMKISTAPASPEEYYEIFRGYAERGCDIISMSLSSKISSTYNVAVGAAARVKEEYPDCDIYCFDSRRMSGSLGLLTLLAHEWQSEGLSMQDVIARLEAYKHRIHQMGPIDDLMFIARRGRISTGKAIMGSFAGVKPMGDCSSDGYVNVLTKVKGVKKALATTVSYIKLAATDIESSYVYITHSNREAYAEQLRERLEAELHPKAVFVSDVFCASGTNIGPGMICASFVGEPVSEGNEVEKALMTKALEE